MSDLITFFMPVTFNDDYGQRQEYHIRLLFKTLALRWKGPLPKIIISTPAGSMTQTRRVLAPFIEQAGLELIADEDLVETPMKEVPGWFRQMIVKLAFSQQVSTPFYLVLDADIVLASSASLNSLMVGKKVLTKWESTKTHPEWWTASRQLLKTPSDLVVTDGLSVTPNMLSTTIAKKTVAMLTAAQGRPWTETLCAQANHSYGPWTEYTLYTLAGMMSGSLLDQHATEREAFLNHSKSLWCNQNLWGPSDVEKIVRRIEENTMPATMQSGLFFIAQSNFEYNALREPLETILLMDYEAGTKAV